MSTSSAVWVSPNGTTYIDAGRYANCTLPACPVALSIYGYQPSLPFSITLIALYAIAAITQLVLGLRYKSWTFMCAMVLGCLDEAIGYIGRIILYHNPWNHSGFILQIVLITIGPVFFSAAIYVLLSVIIKQISPESSRFSPVTVYRTFIPLDITSLILQAVGGAISSSIDADSSDGVNIALAGLVLQVATLVTFIGLATDYALRSRVVWSSIHLTMRFKVFIAALTTATILILVRCSYRIYELNQGYQRTSSALRDQGLFIGLESVLIMLAAYAMIFAHPGPVMHERKIMLARNLEVVQKHEENV